MRLAFVDFIYAYDAARPDTDEPLGGTTSAVCFLARALVAAGVECAFFNRLDKVRHAHGIAAFPLQGLADDIAEHPCDAYIFCGRWTRELVGLVRAHTTKPLIAWMHENVFAEPMTPALDEFDAVVFVSEWQQRVNQASVKPHWRQMVMRNAMNPAVARSFAATDKVREVKADPPVLLFAGSFARGAFHIPPLLDKIGDRAGDFTVEMFCNLDPSRDVVQDALYIDWLRSLPRIAHVGMVGQGELARRMRHASVLLMPNPWPETSCIALIEALASGLVAVTTNRAALPETGAGFTRQIPITHPDAPHGFDGGIDLDAFADAVVDALRQLREQPMQQEEALRRQIDFFHAYYQWHQRVEPLWAFIAGLRHK